MIHGWVVAPDTRKIIDEVLWVCMKKPHSYTGEDVAEIHTHGSYVVLQLILDHLLTVPEIRLATPGEFTRRACLNGRMDLTHAEAIKDIISAQTPKALQMTSAHLDGRFHNLITQLRKNILNTFTRIEASIDFPEDLGDDAPFEIQLKPDIDDINQLIASYDQTVIYREGVRVVIVGRPNVGKSSLLNCLLAKDRAIVSQMPGTTRDSIDAKITIENIPITIYDTAGIHETDDTIEQQGIHRAKTLIEQAQLVLFLVESDKNLLSDDFYVYQAIKDQTWLLCANKIDRVKDKIQIQNIPETWPPPISISARHDIGIDRLKKAIVNSLIIQCSGVHDSEFMINLRQKKCLVLAKNYLEQARTACIENMPLDCVAIDIRLALDALGEITGAVYHEQILDEIFSSFCIGK
ncbi:MAG: tRNA modification GTPase MnmE [Candidatus Magnetoglobus multicellularis str. Araruama]|uniref:tRNA modification GTPase MnmE n=1 Tax=Candidatus Magnetoglobus multicellularis str. Araruama TaxID=890399 RepID=A0A1V1PDC9_9BACT|nr:MAG: tRNA modification GTPase MnmE [Candidatus Magnetoglobus multicellularis str. Araruama]